MGTVCFMFRTSRRVKLWEAALLAALALALTAGGWASESQRALAGRVLRLHVVANSDSPRDQALKLSVRDAVLAAAAPLLEGASGREEAEAALAPHLGELEAAARSALAAGGAAGRVSAAMEDQWFPTKVYGGFSLPAGRYRALRVVIGEGRGQNWWCVVFPPLCTEALAGPAEDAFQPLEGEDAAETDRDGTGYEIRFRLLEWWGMLVQALR